MSRFLISSCTSAKGRVVGSICDPSQPDEHYLTGGSLAEWYDAVIHQYMGV